MPAKNYHRLIPDAKIKSFASTLNADQSLPHDISSIVRPVQRSIHLGLLPAVSSLRQEKNEELKMKDNLRERYLPVVMLPTIMPVVLLPGMKDELQAYLFYGIWVVSFVLAIAGVTWMAKGVLRYSEDS